MQIDKLNSELILKSNALEEKDLQILELAATTSSQTQQIEVKTAQLADLNIQIAKLERSIESNEQVISLQESEIEQLNERLTLQRDEIQDLRLQASTTQDEIEILQNKIQENEEQIQSFQRTRVQHYSLAIDQNDEGWVLPIEVEIIPSGDGTVSIDVKNVQYETGFQTAIRNAVEVASDYSRVSVSDKDIIIRVVNEFDDPSGELTIDGASAGALITAMIIAGLSHEVIDSSVFITGTIEPDGTVGRIGGLEEKTKAAVDSGATTLLVPEEQEYDDPSIRIVGISDIDDVMRYLIQ
jgi:predicted ATP-dependent protease